VTAVTSVFPSERYIPVQAGEGSRMLFVCLAVAGSQLSGFPRVVGKRNVTPRIHNHTFAELKVGDTASIARTLTYKAIEIFAIMSGDVNPANVDQAFTKSDSSPVVGQADIFVALDPESGNMLAKQLEYLAGAEGGGIELGARVPIILTGRADKTLARLSSCALTLLWAHHQQQGKATAV
jgi:hypothetical protein